MFNPNDKKLLEKYSSAVTLSDMEIFIFPEIMYSLVLANIMSPRIWEWKKDPWFAKLPKMNEYRKLLRTKQFIMNQFTFNLDLDTWGLTTKEKELNRFNSYIDKKILGQSNALFGYEGDKYYFDIDIRRHFGLEKYTDNVIPYWKTETLEAMEAFKYKENYPSGAGECVSLSTLYAAALYVIAGINLDKIHLLATPLHSQNFIELKEGIITNNRRIVTKNMWFNGTEITAKARRALENEKITMVVNNHGYIHTMYDEFTMPVDKYKKFSKSLKHYLRSDIDYYILCSFLRQHGSLQKKFQIEHELYGKKHYLELEKSFHYEHGSRSRMGDDTQKSLLNEIDEDEYYPSPIGDRIILNKLESFLSKTTLPLECSTPGCTHVSEEVKIDALKECCEEFDEFMEYFSCADINVELLIRDLIKFSHICPQLPDHNKKQVSYDPIDLSGCKTREDVISYLESIRKTHPVADLAFTAYRDMSKAPWEPFVKAAFERNPVSAEQTKEFSVEEVAKFLSEMNNESIYDGQRLAQPDEVWNYKRGDGIEKAFTLANIIKNRGGEFSFKSDKDKTVVVMGNKEFSFNTAKNLQIPNLN